MPRLTDEQIAARSTFIGASDIGAIAGLNPFKDAFDVLNDKLGFVSQGSENDAADWGHRLEPVVREWYAATSKVTLIPCGTVRSATREWAGATLDSKIVGTRRGLEIKVVGHRMVFDWDPGDDEGIPHYVRAQVAWQMMVVDLDEIDVAALLGGTQARVWRIARDADLETRLVEMGERFWRDNVQGGVAPVITGSASVRAYLDGKYPPPPAPVRIDAENDDYPLVSEYGDARSMRDEAEKRVRQATQELIARLGAAGATDLVGEGWEFRYRPRKDGSRQPWFKRKGDR
jgi:putative phage-type endonuclease